MSKTCLACRASKIKCTYHHNACCRRCASKNIPCVPTTPRHGKVKNSATKRSFSAISSTKITGADPQQVTEMIGNMAIGNLQSSKTTNGGRRGGINLKEHVGLHFLTRFLYCTGMYYRNMLTVSCAYQVAGKMGLSMDELMLRNTEQWNHNLAFISRAIEDMKTAANIENRTDRGQTNTSNSLLQQQGEHQKGEQQKGEHQEEADFSQPLQYRTLPLSLRRLMMGGTSIEQVNAQELKLLQEKIFLVRHIGNNNTEYDTYYAYHSTQFNANILSHDEAKDMLKRSTCTVASQPMAEIFPESEQKQVSMLMASAICQHQNCSKLPSRPSTLLTKVRTKPNGKVVPVFCTVSLLIVHLTETFLWMEITPVIKEDDDEDDKRKKKKKSTQPEPGKKESRIRVNEIEIVDSVKKNRKTPKIQVHVNSTTSSSDSRNSIGIGNNSESESDHDKMSRTSGTRSTSSISSGYGGEDDKTEASDEHEEDFVFDDNLESILDFDAIPTTDSSEMEQHLFMNLFDNLF